MFDRPRNIDNEISKVEINNVNDNVKRSPNQVDRIADRIMQKLQTTDNREFYCKVGWKLSESIINDNLEIALKGRSPQKYFTWLCKRIM